MQHILLVSTDFAEDLRGWRIKFGGCEDIEESYDDLPPAEAKE